MWRGLSALALTVSLLGAAQAPRDASNSQSGTGVIRGRVVADAGGEPIRKARVVLSSIPDPVFTDSDGRFAFSGVKEGRYTVSARKAGYAPTTYGSRRPGAPPIVVEVADASVADGIEVRMPKGAGISGRVVDQYGEPIEGAGVLALRLAAVDGRQQTVPVASAGNTDDLGEYRIGALPAGNFLIAAQYAMTNTADGRVTVQQASAYYPGVPGVAAAQPLTVHPGDELSAIDFTLVSTPTGSVTVALLDQSGQGVGGSITLMQAGSMAAGRLDVRGMMAGTAGPMRQTLPAGEWTLLARGLAGGVGIARFTIGPSDTSIAITLGKGATIRGRVLLDGAPMTQGAMPIVQAAILVPGAAAFGVDVPVRIGSDGSFEMIEILGPRELNVLNVPPGQHVEAITINGQDVSGVPIDFKPGDVVPVEVRLTSRVASLHGTVLGADEARLADYSVLLFPDEDGFRHARTRSYWVRPNQRGEFAVEGLLPGAYLVAVVDDVDDTRWPSAEYLAELRPRATKIAVAEREKKIITLRVGASQ